MDIVELSELSLTRLERVQPCIPEIVITDAATNLPIWVDSKNQGWWLEVIQEQMQFVENE